MTSEDVESIERATVAAVAPEALEEIPGWLLPIDSGVVGRAKSAVPLVHSAPEPQALAAIEERYVARDLPPVLRVPTAASFDAFRELLTRSGYISVRPTQVHTALASVVRRVSSQGPAELATAPDQAWAAVFLGAVFDSVDGASRVRTLSRAPGSLFASLREQGQTVAAGAVAFGHGWASVHGMRTAQACRGRGLAGRVLVSLADAALSRGFERMFLQVEAHNLAAHAMYRRAGFELAWSYDYWQKPA